MIWLYRFVMICCTFQQSKRPELKMVASIPCGWLLTRCILHIPPGGLTKIDQTTTGPPRRIRFDSVLEADGVPQGGRSETTPAQKCAKHSLAWVKQRWTHLPSEEKIVSFFHSISFFPDCQNTLTSVWPSFHFEWFHPKQNLAKLHENLLWVLHDTAQLPCHRQAWWHWRRAGIVPPPSR